MFESHNRLVTKATLGTNRSGGRLGRGQAFLEPTESGVGFLPSFLPDWRHSSLEEAVEFFELRAKFLGKIRCHLEKMQALAQANRGKVDEERSQSYHHHACTVRQIVATDYNGAPLFARDGIVAEAGDNENHLVMEGLDLSHPAIAAATQTTIASKETARSAAELLCKALRYLTVVESALEAHRSRLSFLSKRLESAPRN